MKFKPVELSSLLEKVGNKVNVDVKESYSQIGIRSHSKGIFYKDPVTGADIGNKSIFHIVPDCFIVNIVFAWEQAIAKTTKKDVGFVASHRFPMYKVCEEKLDLDYLLYFFKTSYGKYLLELASPGGAGRNKTLGQQAFMKLKIPLPSISEQKKIVKILLSCDSSILKYKDIIEQKKNRKNELIEKLLTGNKRFNGFKGDWSERKLSDLSSLITKGTTPTSIGYKFEDSGINFIKVESVNTQGQFNKEKFNYISNECNNRLKRSQLKTGDILFSIAGALGRTAIVNNTILPANTNQAFAIIRLLDETQIKASYLNAYFKTRVVEKWMKVINVQGAQPNLSLGELGKLKIRFPDVSEQEKIIEVINATEQDIILTIDKMELSQNLRKGLMQQLLTGKKRVKVD